MLHKHLSYYLRYLDHDIPAGVVVFLVALPLCLGIAVASGAPPVSGILAGLIGGLVVSILSGSQLSVSGPAAGLTVIIATAIGELGFEGMLLATALAGLMQLAMGFLRAGVIGAFFPSAVIKGMLAAIGVILIMKQLPYAFGYDVDADSDLSFLEDDKNTNLPLASKVLGSVSTGAIIVSVVSLVILLVWETQRVKRNRILALIPAPLLAVLFGVAFNGYALQFTPELAIQAEHLVSLPRMDGLSNFLAQLRLPNFSLLLDPRVYLTAVTLAVVASLETLLSLEAVDKLDPLNRTASTDRELIAQGVGNFVSGLIGGLPITAVIVRSSANVNAGAHTKVASFVHGGLLLVSVLLFSRYLNAIPLACLASVLLLTGYKLANPQLALEQYSKGFNQFAPFVVTVAAILLTDLLKGMAIGMAVGLFFVLRANYHSAFALTRDGKNYLLRLQKDASFLNKAQLRSLLGSIGENSCVVIDGSRAHFIDHDILELLEAYVKAAVDDNIRVELKNVCGLSAPNGLASQTLADSPDAGMVVAH
jgi:MFS superfamily sulfate permease-like transporter